MSPLAKGRSPATPRRILVVDDQDTIREFMCAALAKAGYEVASAANGAEALAAVRELSVDLVVMDIQMPVMDGFAATRQIRLLDGARSKVPIIALSGDRRALATEKVDDHLAKPFRKADFLRKIAQWLPPPPAGDSPQRAGGMLDQACELMGRPWTMAALQRLVVQIDEMMFGKSAAGPLDEGDLAGQAHRMVSLAALLGFARLAELCSMLEDACRKRCGAALALELVTTAAAGARANALDLLARDGAATG